MRYILDDLGYVEEVSFGGTIECNKKTCVEYTGAIPEEYDSLIEWVENANIRAYKIANGNLTLDETRATELEALYNEELTREVKITSTNTPPDATGNWELIDKEFKSFNGNATFTKNKSSSATLSCSRQGHNIYNRLTFTNSGTLNDTTVEIGTISLSSLGVTDLSFSKYPVGQTDGGGAVLMMEVVANTGVVRVNDVIDKGGTNQVSSSVTCIVEWSNTIPMEYMLDSAVDKFYWKRKSN